MLSSAARPKESSGERCAVRRRRLAAKWLVKRIHKRNNFTDASILIEEPSSSRQPVSRMGRPAILAELDKRRSRNWQMLPISKGVTFLAWVLNSAS